MKKITDEQLSELQSLLKEKEQILISIGDIESRKHVLLHEVVNTDKKISNMSNVLKEQYGDVEVNVTTGEITSNE